MSVMTLAQRVIWRMPKNAVRHWREFGAVSLGAKVWEKFTRVMKWHLPNPLSAKLAGQWQHQFTKQPKISIVVPVYRTPEAWLESCVESVRSQYYANWELILVDDASQQPEFTAKLQSIAQCDSRIQVISLKKNAGIAGATNAGIEEATGEFVGFLDHDDELTPDALTWMVAAHNRHPNAVWFYSDEDKITEAGEKSEPYLPFFKPAYSPEFLLSVMFTSHFSMYSLDKLREVGGLRLGFDGAQDHDLALRISETVQRDQVVHVPRVLYHWRMVEGSTATDGGAKPEAARNGRKAVAEALQRRGLTGEVTSHFRIPTAYQIRFHPQSSPAVRIIIPTHNGISDLKACLDSIDQYTRYQNYRITIIDNRSTDKALLAYLDEAEAKGKLEVVRDSRPFNHSQMHNDVIANCEEDYLVFMNNDVEIITDGWLEQLVASAESDSSVAGVGTLLLFPDRTVQHGGIYLGRMGVAGHSHRDLKEEEPGYFGQAHLLRESSGATAALLLMRRSAFDEVGGFDAKRYPTSFNDVDLWLRLKEQGHRCLYNPQVRAIHHESKSRGVNLDWERECGHRFREQWGAAALNDPFCNPNIDPMDEGHSRIIAYPVRELKEEQFRCLPPVRKSTHQKFSRRAA